MSKSETRAATARGVSGRAAWPYSAPTHVDPLPPTLPDGRAWPKISIVTPSYNQGQFIEQTILSVMNQGYPNVEHIIIDGGSTDETRAILERYRDRLAGVVSERDKGQGDALNKGFTRATGDILTWLNSDDRLAPGALAAVGIAFATSGADMVAGVCEIMQDETLIEQHITCCGDGPLPLDDLLDIENCWQGGQFFYQPEVMFTRRLWEAAGARIDERWYYSMDYELWLRFAEHGARLHVIGRAVAQFRVHPQQKTVDPQKFIAELNVVREEFLKRTQRRWRPPAPSFGGLHKRIVLFNDMGFDSGAGLAHGRLAQACARAGHEVIPLAVTQGPTFDRTPPVTNEAIVRRIEEYRPNLVVLGNLHSAALDASVIDEIAQRWPTACVLHDAWLLTGRCAYNGECAKYLTGCDATCPTADEYPALAPERIRPAFDAKRRILTDDCAPALFANSQWLAEFARGALRGSRAQLSADAPHSAIETIRLGLPLDVFRPRDRDDCREAHGLPHDKFIIMTSGTTATDPRKGLAHLAAALERLNLPDVLVVALGVYDKTQPPVIPGMRAMGYLKDPLKVAQLYSAADVFVGPSVQEAFGQVFVEAAACGTPAIGYPVGGVPEALADGVTGRLAASVDPTALADAILEIYGSPGLRRNLAAWGRIHVENEFSLARVANGLYAALERSGLRERIGLRRKIQLAAGEFRLPVVRLIASEYPRWQAVSGFLEWEGPYPQDNLARCRWTTGPVSRIATRVESAGRYLLLITLRNYWEGQRLRIVHHSQACGEMAVPLTRNLRDHVACCELELDVGEHEIELHHWKWDATRPDRPVALLVTSIELVSPHSAAARGEARFAAPV